MSSQQNPRQSSAVSDPWYRRRPDVLVFSIVVGPCALIGLLLLGPLFLMALDMLLLGGCSAEERAVYEEFSHYGDRQIEPYSGEVSCNARYPTRASRDEVLGYYDEQLRKNGWEVGGYWAADPPKGIEVFGEHLSDLSEAPESVGGGLGARRDGYRYGVTYSPPGSGDPGETPGGEEVSAEDAEVVVEVNDEPGGGFPK
jgi:hypothetical protein